MTMTLAALVALSLSAIPIIALCDGDPKRQRSSGGKGGGMGKGLRRSLAAIAVMPGIACAAFGNSAAFLLWLGGCALAGWSVTFCFHAVAQSTSRSV
jgi:hypothetical protein